MNDGSIRVARLCVQNIGAILFYPAASVGQAATACPIHVFALALKAYDSQP
jgi:hypothetical protein